MHQIMPISAMENVERAFASEVRLIIEHSSRKCYLNLVAELSGTMGPRSSCRKMQWLAMMISFFVAFLALWDFADHQTAKFEPKRTHNYSYQPNDWLQTSENSNAVQQDMANIQESLSNRPESLVDEKVGVEHTQNALYELAVAHERCIHAPEFEACSRENSADVSRVDAKGLWSLGGRSAQQVRAWDGQR